jgi:hypothetical protein
MLLQIKIPVGVGGDRWMIYIITQPLNYFMRSSVESFLILSVITGATVMQLENLFLAPEKK